MRTLILVALVMMINACGNVDLDDYASTEPQLQLETFFDGNLVAYGLVLDRSGALIRRFDVELVASWVGNKGVIKEWFEFDDGERTTRTWQIENLGDNHYQGTAEDVVGIAKGRAKGSALYWQYDLKIPIGDDIYEVTLDDWMFLMDERRLFNKTTMSKWGFDVGELIIYIEKK